MTGSGSLPSTFGFGPTISYFATLHIRTDRHRTACQQPRPLDTAAAMADTGTEGTEKTTFVGALPRPLRSGIYKPVISSYPLMRQGFHLNY